MKNGTGLRYCALGGIDSALIEDAYGVRAEIAEIKGVSIEEVVRQTEEKSAFLEDLFSMDLSGRKIV